MNALLIIHIVGVVLAWSITGLALYRGMKLWVGALENKNQNAEILRTLKEIKMNQAELQARLEAADAKATKIAKEQADRAATQTTLIETQTKTIEELRAAIEAGGTVSPATEAALVKLEGNLEAFDETILDAVTPA